MWQNNINEFVWYVDHIKIIEDSNYLIDYLHISADCDLKWKYSKHDYIKLTEFFQLVICTVKGD